MQMEQVAGVGMGQGVHYFRCLIFHGQGADGNKPAAECNYQGPKESEN